MKDCFTVSLMIFGCILSREEIDPHYEKKKDSFMNKNVLFRNMDEYKEYGWALSPGSQLERNEFQRRRLLYLIYEHKP